MPIEPLPGRREPNPLFYQAFLHSADAMLVTDRAGVIVDVNPAFERVYGYTRAECVGRTPRLVKSTHTPRRLYDQLWADLLNPAKGHWSGELVNLDKARREHAIRLTIDAVRDHAGKVTHFIGVVADLSERQSLERQAQHAERLASIGQLAAGVAHELNTPLASMVLIAEEIRGRSTDAATLDLLRTLDGQVEAASRIVRGLLDFSRPPTPSLARVDLVASARDAIAFLRKKYPPGVRILEEYASPRLTVRGDRDQFHQLFVNLLKNAYEALDGKGTIAVSMGLREGAVEARIADDGPGIPQDLLPRIFDPFFTTKPPGAGTGLGLSICQAIAVRHGGEIRVESTNPTGATFVVRLPAATEPTARGSS